VLVAVTDPPDPLADLIRALAGHERVLGTGTVIDTLRFRVHIAAHLGIHPSAVEGLVVGEHGTSEVMLWSSVRVAGAPLTDALGLGDPPRSLDELREDVERDVRFANITIIEGTGASQFGLGVACADRRSDPARRARRPAGGGVPQALRRDARAADGRRTRGRGGRARAEHVRR
jgi:L-lactate dehydrogenase